MRVATRNGCALVLAPETISDAPARALELQAETGLLIAFICAEHIHSFFKIVS
jgi:hypothetical protein